MSAHAAFQDNLKFVRTAVPQYIDSNLQLWLVEVSCHALATSIQFGSGAEVVKALDFADRWVTSQPNVPPMLRLYHAIVKAFYLLRTGEMKKMSALVDEIKTYRDTNVPIEPFLESLLHGLELEVMKRHDPCQAMALSMTAIHRLQSTLPMYAARPEVYVLLLACLFDMLHTHCELHCQQARYHEMAVSISQTLQLFATYKTHLKTCFVFPFYLAQTHVLIAKYAQAVGKQRDAESHLRYVVSQLLPPIRPDDAAYPQLYLRVWVDVLDCSLFCSGVADANFAIHSSGSNGVQIRHICPSPSQLAFAGQLLEMDVLRDAVQADTNVELRARYEMLVCKWLWATQEVGVAAGAHSSFARYEKLESRRPEMLRLLHESLERVSAHVNCTDATAEIMALFGPKLVEQNRLENGEETLKSAIRLGLHSKNVLLQTRLLVDIFRLYSFRQLVQAQATTAEKYEKKVNVLQRRIAQALAENATSTSILSWSAADT
ncbi:hypothetical protein ATCC90586_007723 [Pythium insidiosum]|nr:hypothetical protein ATCC90586_007723 [Pythium insidiosum]